VVVAATMVTMTVQVCVGMYWPLMWTMKAKVLPLIAAALRLRLAHVDADVLGYSRGRARYRAQPVQVKHRQLRRNHQQPSCSLRTLSSSLSAQSAPQSLRRHHHVAQVCLQILFISCLSQPPPPHHQRHIPRPNPRPLRCVCSSGTRGRSAGLLLNSGPCC
jgi:hypothetical protein